MTRKVAIVGAGTAGAISAAFLSSPNYLQDTEVVWYYDSNTPTQAVGEGSNLVVPRHLRDIASFRYNDLYEVEGSFKAGVAKYNWGTTNKYFLHDFAPPSVAYHFNALMLQKFIRDRISDRVTFVDKNVTHEDIDADYILDCSGRPKTFDDFYVVDCIPVNSVHVTQCEWEYPRFQHTLTIARKHGWIFGIPLQKRCAIGYLYNNSISTLDYIKEDVQEVFEEFNLTPSTKTNSFSFSSYYRKFNFTDRIAYNGNASFFAEPLEATTIGNMIHVNTLLQAVFRNKLDFKSANEVYRHMNRGVVDMIMLHYYAGSSFNSPFWQYAQQLGIDHINKAIRKSLPFRNICENALKHINRNEPYARIVDTNEVYNREYGSWNLVSFAVNIRGLGITKNIEELIQNSAVDFSTTNK